MLTWEQLKEKGNEEYKRKNYNQAISFYNDAIEQQDNQEVLYANRGLCQKALSRYKLALLDFEKALGINPRSVKNLKRKAEVLLILGRLPDAQRVMEQCAHIERHDRSHVDDILRVKNLILLENDLDKNFKSEDFPKVEELSRKLVDSCPAAKEFKTKYIEALLYNNKIQEAINMINGLSNEEKADDDFHYLTCLAMYYKGNYDKAKSLVNSLISRNNTEPKYKKLQFQINNIEKDKQIANDFVKKANYSKALEQYDKLLEYDPRNRTFNSTIHANKGLCLQKMNKNLEALTEMNKSIALNDKYTKAYLRRANIHMSLNNFEEAKYDFNKVRELEPGNQEALKGAEEAKKKEKQAKKKDYYKILDLPRDANENDIRKAYKKLAIKWHPDKNTESDEKKLQAEKRFKEINEAYAVLSDPKKKQMFDSGVDPNDPESGGHGFSQDDVNNIFQQFFQGGGPGGFTTFTTGNGFEGFEGFGGDGFDGFSGFPGFFSFGGQNQGGRGGRRSGGMPGAQTFTFKFG